jgi:hypothetical protein
MEKPLCSFSTTNGEYNGKKSQKDFCGENKKVASFTVTILLFHGPMTSPECTFSKYFSTNKNGQTIHENAFTRYLANFITLLRRKMANNYFLV